MVISRVAPGLMGVLVMLAAVACDGEDGGTSTPAATPSPAATATATAESAGFVTAASGLQYRDDVIGTGAQPATGQRVTVHYTGQLEDGTVFDTSRGRGPFTFIIGVGDVIRGWDEGVATMRTGGRRTLVIPPDLGYGAGGYPPVIPANATLIFDVELLSVE